MHIKDLELSAEDLSEARLIAALVADVLRARAARVTVVNALDCATVETVEFAEAA